LHLYFHRSCHFKVFMNTGSGPRFWNTVRGWVTDCVGGIRKSKYKDSNLISVKGELGIGETLNSVEN
jgi:hypothetical protein